jgi:ribosome-binding protein aMBF1 (putative translation factor)
MKANKDIEDFDAVLDAKYGAPGTEDRAQAEEAAFAYYSGLLLKKARKEMGMTQGELAAKLGTDTAYISRIENNAIIPSVGQFYRIANALGFSVELVHSIR